MNGQAWLMWACALAFAAVVFMSAPTVGQGCYAPTALNFTSERGGLWVNGQRFRLKGTSWFGFETSAQVAHGLWSVSYTSLLDFLATNGFNAIRMPFQLQLALNDAQPNGINYGANSDLQGLSSLQVMDKIIQGAAARGIVIMLDLHSFQPDSFLSDGMWYNGANPESKVIQGWTKILQRYANQWNVIAADLKNEPHSSTWGTGNPNTDWNLGAARLANAIASGVSPRFLMFVEGVTNSPSSAEPCFYGENLIGAKTNPVDLDHPYKLVYSPHVYGPNVYGQPYFSVGNFPDNMPAIWDAHFGFIPSTTGRAMVIGEWGGPFTGKDAQWMTKMKDYLLAKDATDQFFWALNPNSGDTGGLIKDDWSSPETGKLSLLSALVSSPTKFSVNGQGQVCVNGGSGNNPAPSASPSPAASASSSPKPSASSSPKPSSSSSPKASASASPATPKASASASPAAPQASASSSPVAPKASASASPAAPKTSASASPAAPQPSASSSPVAPKPSASSSPAAPQPSSSPAAPPATDGFSFYTGTSAWWMAVTIPGSTSVSIDCGNGQGLVEMTPAWMPNMWTFTSTNGHACTSTLTFVVNGGASQTITAPWA